jgi:hypothetical protein
VGPASVCKREEGQLGRVEELGRKEGWAAGVLTRLRKKRAGKGRWAATERKRADGKKRGREGDGFGFFKNLFRNLFKLQTLQTFFKLFSKFLNHFKNF